MIFAASLAALTMVPVCPALAAAPLPLKDSVTCIYDAMTPEQREIVQTLLLQNMESGGSPMGDNPSGKEIEASAKDAMDACVDKYAWSSGKSESAASFAMLSLLSEALGPLLEADGVVLDDIDGYIAVNKSTFRLNRAPSKAMSAGLFADLAKKGWNLGNERTKQGAELYFRLQLGREAARRMFAQNVTYRR